MECHARRKREACRDGNQGEINADGTRVLLASHTCLGHAVDRQDYRHAIFWQVGSSQKPSVPVNKVIATVQDGQSTSLHMQTVIIDKRLTGTDSVFRGCQMRHSRELRSWLLP